MIKSLILLIIATALMVTGLTVIYKAIRAKRFNEDIGHDFNEPSHILIWKIVGVIFLLGSFALAYVSFKVKPIFYYDDNGKFFAFEKKDSLVFGGNVYVLKDSCENECK